MIDRGVPAAGHRAEVRPDLEVAQLMLLEQHDEVEVAECSDRHPAGRAVRAVVHAEQCRSIEPSKPSLHLQRS